MVTAILIVGVVAFTYTALGGIVAVIWTDVIQSVILFMLIGALPDGRPFKQDGWYAVAGKIDRPGYWLLGYFAACVAALWLFEAWI